ARRQPKQAATAVVRGSRSSDQTAALEAPENAAEISRIEAEIAGEVAGRRRLAGRQLVEHPHLRQREGAGGQMVTQHADAPGIEAVERPDGPDSIDPGGARSGGLHRPRL